MAVAKDQIRQIISQNNINSVSDVYSLLKERFKDILRKRYVMFTEGYTFKMKINIIILQKKRKSSLFNETF
jgi:hypothetical protein